MAKAFDLVHKVSDVGAEPDEPLPFDDKPSDGEPPKKKRVRVEVIFFYLLLFAIFFIMGMMFLAPNLLSGKKTVASASPKPSATPIAGFTIDKQGQSVDQAAKDLGVSPSPTVTLSPATSTAPTIASATSTPASHATKIQILNGTTHEGAAAALRSKLASKGIVVDSIGNYKKQTVAKTTVYFTTDYKTAAQQVLAVTGGILIQASSTTTAGNDVLVVIGRAH